MTDIIDPFDEIEPETPAPQAGRQSKVDHKGIIVPFDELDEAAPQEQEGPGLLQMISRKQKRNRPRRR